ncbi:MAG: RagB/SusD family nutrient uptake outer membrane protein [Butyricimonas faecalis]
MDAEAYADVKKVVENRVEDITKVGDISESGVELKRFIFNERRREFCFEGQRWYDLKRTKLFAKQIDHKFTEVNNSGAIMGTELYMLSPNDPNYVYPIPQDELDVNNVIEQNERVENYRLRKINREMYGNKKLFLYRYWVCCFFLSRGYDLSLGTRIVWKG